MAHTDLPPQDPGAALDHSSTGSGEHRKNDGRRRERCGAHGCGGQKQWIGPPAKTDPCPGGPDVRAIEPTSQESRHQERGHRRNDLQQQGALHVVVVKVSFQELRNVRDIGQPAETVHETAQQVPTVAAVVPNHAECRAETLHDARPEIGGQAGGVLVDPDSSKAKIAEQAHRSGQHDQHADHRHRSVSRQIQHDGGDQKGQQVRERRPFADLAGRRSPVGGRVVEPDDGCDGRPTDRAEHEAQARQKQEYERTARQRHSGRRRGAGHAGHEDKRNFGTRRHPTAQIEGRKHPDSRKRQAQAELPDRGPHFFQRHHRRVGNDPAGHRVQQGVRELVPIRVARVGRQRWGAKELADCCQGRSHVSSGPLENRSHCAPMLRKLGCHAGAEHAHANAGMTPNTKA